MTCAWNELLAILPPRLRGQVDEKGRDSGQNIRLRLNSPPEICCGKASYWLNGMVTQEDLNFCINTASRYSPWAAATMAKGYLSSKGGHRLGICGEAVMKNGAFTGIRNVTSICIRVARDFPGIASELAALQGSILILGAPGWGKTTLLRDLIRQKDISGCHVSVLDEREELFPAGQPCGHRTEVLSGCPKGQGVDMLLRTMSPDIIALDEITAPEDCLALSRAAWCGVSLLATAHAASLRDFLHREIYTPLVTQAIFDHIVILHSDKSWHVERSKGWTTNGSVRY